MRLELLSQTPGTIFSLPYATTTTTTSTTSTATINITTAAATSYW
jgi:hypothetical protein